MQNFMSHTHITKPRGFGDYEILQNGVFQLSTATRGAENILIIEEKLDELMATDRSYTEHYRSRRSTTGGGGEGGG